MSNESKYAVVFPGQGSQSIGMMNSLIDIKPDITELYWKKYVPLCVKIKTCHNSNSSC